MRKMVYDYPLRPDFLAQVVLPSDLTAVEAERLRAFIMSLANELYAADRSEGK